MQNDCTAESELTAKWHINLTVRFINENCVYKNGFEKKNQRTKKHAKLPSNAFMLFCRNFQLKYSQLEISLVSKCNVKERKPSTILQFSYFVLKHRRTLMVQAAIVFPEQK